MQALAALPPEAAVVAAASLDEAEGKGKGELAGVDEADSWARALAAAMRATATGVRGNFILKRGKSIERTAK